jgi:hypothetical protein
MAAMVLGIGCAAWIAGPVQCEVAMMQRQATADPRPFLRHLHLAMRWARCTGKTCTEQRVSRIMGRFDAETLSRKLAERGVRVE